MPKDRLDETQQFALGTLVRKVHTLSADRLRELLDRQKGAPTAKLGEIMVAAGVLTEEGLEMMLQVQQELRSKKPHVRAMAMARLAEATKQNVERLTEIVRTEVAETRRHTSGQYPAARVPKE